MSQHKSKNIGFDLDDVIFNFNDAIQAHFNKKFNKNISREQRVNYHLDTYYDLTEEQIRQALDDFYPHEDHMNALPLEDSLDSIKILSENNKLFIVTARQDKVSKLTQDWIDVHFPNIFEEIHFTNHANLEKRRLKSEIAKEIGINIFIDDSLDNAYDLSDAGIPVLLFDTPWNQIEKLPELITRVYSWKEILEKLK